MKPKLTILFFTLIPLLSNAAYIEGPKSIYDKWFNDGNEVYIATPSTIICTKKDALASLYNRLMMRGGVYRNSDITALTDSACSVFSIEAPVKIHKTYYQGRIVEIEYATADNVAQKDGSNKVVYTVFKSDANDQRYMLRSQIMNAKEYQQQMIHE